MSLEQTVDNLEIRYANAVTFVGTSNTMIDTTTGRIQTKGIQHNSNVITDVSGPHGRVAPTLKKYPEIVFEEGKFDYNTTTNTFVQAGYTITSSGNFSDDVNSVYTAWRAFTGLINLFDPGWVSPSGSYTSGVANSTQSLTNIDTSTSTGSVSSRNGAWIKLELPTKIKLGRVDFYDRYDDIEGTATQYERVSEAFVYGGNSNSGPWYEIGKQSDATNLANYTDNIPASLTIDTTSYYKYYIIQPTQLARTISYASYGQLMFYGYEEDPPAGDHSVDTTFMSRFNNPQTTGVQVLVDGATGVGTNQISGGPDPSGNQSTYVTDGKYWTLNGTLTSNLSVEANTFLEGDQPHAVSVWFNSSNLEANVSNTCVFSISDQEKLDSVNLDLQSNTWHNLTYAYQGEGGSRVTYLDGRKVAEDQAEDTFGDYPPFAMTGYSQGGYVVSASTDTYSTTGFYAWKAFNDVQANEGWHTGTGNGATNHFAANAGGSVYNASLVPAGYSTSLGGNTGEWIKLEMPHKLVVDYVTLKSRGTSLASTQSPKDFKILGSNDDINWDILESFTSVPYSMTGENHVVGATKGYKYIALLVTRIQVTTISSCVVGEIEYYGHRENDLVRLPDPTNVLKYPHIAMTGPAQRGYVVSASAEDSANSRYAWKAFNNILPADLSTDFWFSESSRGAYTGGTSGREYVGSSNLGTDSGRTATVDGEWIQVQLPNKIQLTTFNIYGQPNTINNFPASGVLYARNETTEDWTSIYVYNDVTISTNHTQATHTPTTSTFYNTYALSITKKSNSIGGVSVGELELYGTEENSSVPIQIGGGNIDKVANFRVYDKFIGEDQALEIWDAQKDAFGRAKSSMTLQKGRLGIGTTEPEGRLAVADEPHNLEEFPPRAMTGYKTYFEGHGEFCVYASTELINANHKAWKSFNKFRGNDGWHTGGVNYTSGVYTAGKSLGGISGDYLVLKLPYKINLKSIAMVPRSGLPQRGPGSGVILGSNDEVNWEQVHSFSGITYTDNVYTTIDAISSTKTYNVFAMVVTNLAGTGVNTDYVNLAEWKLFGTREQGQSVLHDGQLTLTKNLNVPRIGPALDADDTPRRDRLVVEYNTSTNPTFEGAVRDTSGRGLDAILVGAATYDGTEKAFEFPNNPADNTNPATGKDSIITHGIPGSRLNTQMTVSTWLRLDSPAQWEQIWGLGSSTTALQHSILFVSNNQLSYQSEGGGGAVYYPYTYTGWNHVTIVRNSATFNDVTFYVNGSVIGSASTSGTGTMIQPDNIKLTIGGAITQNQYWLDGSISNFKLYDCALTAEEVKRLYDMGRLSNAVKTPLQIEAPVDIRGDIRYITNIRPLPLRTMWDHESNGHFTRGIYPITGTQGGSKVYNMLCEPDWCGGGWMCAAQLPRGKDVVTTTVNLFTADYGDPSNLAWSNDFAVPMNIFSNNSGYDLDVMLVLLGGRRAGRAGAGGARNGGIYRGVNLTQALNTGWPTNGVYPADISTSGLASSADGYTFVSRTPVSGGNFQPYKANSAWRLSFSSVGGNDMAYDDYDINTMGWLVHTDGNNINYTYNSVHGGGGSQNELSETSWSAIRLFVRPKRY